MYASPGSSDAASSYPRLIRVAMMYNDKVGYGPTVSQALDGIFGAGAGATAAGPAPLTGPGSKAEEGAAALVPAAVPEVPAAAAGVPGGGATLSAAKSAAPGRDAISHECGPRRPAFRELRAIYGQALQRLDEAMGKFDSAQ